VILSLIEMPRREIRFAEKVFCIDLRRSARYPPIVFRSGEFKLKSGINRVLPFILPRPRDLSSPPLRTEKGDCILLLMIVRSFLALKKQNGLGSIETSCKSVVPILWAPANLSRSALWYVASIGSPITNHQPVRDSSRVRATTSDHVLASHLSPSCPT
jgi:hypothetical protein